MKPVVIKSDNRYRKGHIVIKNGVLVGHSETVAMNTYKLPPLTDETARIMRIEYEKYMLAPPIVIGHDLAKVLEGNQWL